VRRVYWFLGWVVVFATILSAREGLGQSGYRQLDAQRLASYRDAAKIFEKARVSFGKHRFKDASEQLRTCLARFPELSDAHLLLAKILYMQKDFSGALVEVELAEKSHEAVGDLMSRMQQDRLSEMRRRRGDSEDLIRSLNASLAQASSDEERKILDKIARAERGLAELDRALEDPFPNQGGIPAPYHFLHGNVLLRLQRFEDAVRQYEQALRADPAYGDAANNLASIYQATRQFERAAAVLAEVEARGAAVNPELKKAIEEPPSPDSATTAAPADPALVAPADLLPIAEAGLSPAGDPPEDLRQGYLAALATYTEADSTVAERAVAELERSALRETRADASTRLLAAELAAARGLVRQEGEALFALMQLHTRLAGIYGIERAVQCQAHAWTMLAELAALAPRAAGESGRARAAEAMACLAGASEQFGAGAAAEHQLTIALLLDPGNTAALEGLAASLEWKGKYREAEQLLRRLVERRPDALEPMLRLALTRQRLGDSSEVEMLLRRVATTAPLARGDSSARTSGDSGGWIRSVAWQELVRRQIEAGAWQAAAEVLAEAVAAVPDDRELAILNAYVLDRSGRRAEARAIAARLAGRAAGSASARFAYAQRPHAELDRTCEALRVYVAGWPTAALARVGASGEGGKGP